MIRWGEPLWLIALVLPLLIMIWDMVRSRQGGAFRTKFASKELWKYLSPGRSAVLRRSKRYLAVAALTMLVIALANPRIGTRWEEVTREGIDIFMLVDVSRSMDAQDIRPSRIAKTRYELVHFLEGLKGDRIGIIPFAGDSYTLMPLTLDYGATGMFINLLETDLIPTAGTDIAVAIDKAIASFPKDEKGSRSRVIVLVSDGEDHEGGVDGAIKRAREAGISIYTIGMALSKGDPIPKFDKNGNRKGWLTDEEGNPVTSALNEDLLRKIAQETGGSYYRATQGGEEFRAVYRKLFGMNREELSSRQITDYEDRFQPFLALSIILFVIEFALPAGRRRVIR